MDIEYLPETWVSPENSTKGDLVAVHNHKGWSVYYANMLDYEKFYPDLQSAVNALMEKIGYSPEPITPSWLEFNGYHDGDNRFGFSEWISEDGQVTVSKLSNMVDREWYVHVDNDSFQTIGGISARYVWELEKILSLLGR